MNYKPAYKKEIFLDAEYLFFYFKANSLDYVHSNRINAPDYFVATGVLFCQV